MATIKNKRDLIAKQNSTIFIVVVVASVIVSASIVATKILWDQRAFQSRVIEAKEEVEAITKANVAAIDDLQESFLALEESDINSTIILDALPSKYDFPALASSIEKIDTLGNYEIESFSGEDEGATAVESDSDPTPIEIPFSLTIRGNYEEIQEFIATIERSIRPFQILTYTLEGADSNDMSLGLQLNTYYQPSRNLEITTRNVQ